MDNKTTNSNSINNFILFYSKNQNLNSIIDSVNYNTYILRCKKGSKIYIKKKNRGKFTEYCGGNVTSECIRKGKNSLNPTIRKRATFADNARKWNK